LVLFGIATEAEYFFHTVKTELTI